MALPKIFQMLFGNDGKGPKLREDILPEIDVGVTSVNGNTGDLTPEQTGCLPISGGNVESLSVQGKRVLVEGESILVGTVIAMAANSAPSGYLLCNGSAVSRTTYATLFSVIGTTYGAGDGSTTFNLPNLTDKFIQGSGTAGTSKSAGLPNITGSIPVGVTSYDSKSVLTNYGSASGALSATSNTTKTNRLGSGTSSLCPILNLDASDSNSIYGSSTTVQPPALTMRMYIKY